MKRLQWYRDNAAKLIEADRRRDDKFRAMDKMYRCDWSAPSELSKIWWWRTIVSSDPHDALNAAVRVLATAEPKITLQPLQNNPETRRRANEIERALAWQYMLASRRSVADVTKDIVSSAFRYDEIAAQVVYLPWQNKIAKDLNARKWDLAGDFAITVHNPISVHTLRSSFGIEGVLLAKNMTVDEVVATWGDAAKGLKKIVDQETQDFEYVTLYDWTDHDSRVVWCTYESTGAGPEQRIMSQSVPEPTSDEGIVIYKEENDLPFLMWVERAGGSAIDVESEYQRKPLLDSVYYTGQWDTQNILDSAQYSLVLATLMSPMSKSTTYDGETPDVDYSAPGGNVALKQNENFEKLPPPTLDPRLIEEAQKQQARIGKSTVPGILQSPDVPSGAAFASINTVLRAASNVLDPGRKLAQMCLADIDTMMLRWYIHTGDPLTGYDTSKKQMGTNIIIPADTLDPKEIYLTVKLTETLPVDEVQRLNGGNLMKALGIPDEVIYEQLDMTNPDELVKDRQMQQLQEAAFSRYLKILGAQGDAEAQRIMAQVQLETQQQQMGMQMEAQQAQMQAQQAQMQPPPEAMMQPDLYNPGGAPQSAQESEMQAMSRAMASLPPDQQTEMLGGMGFNPAMGGTPPATGAPSVTRESVQGMDRQGNPL